MIMIVVGSSSTIGVVVADIDAAAADDVAAICAVAHNTWNSHCVAVVTAIASRRPASVGQCELICMFMEAEKEKEISFQYIGRFL